MSAVGAVMVGGQSRRMGRDKAGLTAPEGGTLLARAASLLAPRVERVVLVGAHPAHRELGWPTLADMPCGVGPIGGLNALLASAPHQHCLVLACDMPYVEAEDLDALLAAGRTAAPRRDGRWEPLCALYGPEAGPVVARRVAAGQHRLQRLLDELEPTVVPIASSHLRDWDRPADVPSLD